MLNKSISFYKKNDVERPGLLSIKLGLSGVLDAKIHLPNAPEESKCFMDSEYETELIVSIDELLSGDKVAQTLSHQIAFAFDVSTPESQ